MTRTLGSDVGPFHSLRMLFVVVSVALISVGMTACAPPTPVAVVEATPVANKELQQHMDASRAALKSGQFEVARVEAAAAVQLDVGNSDAQYLLGNAYNRLAEPEVDAQKRQNHLSNAITAYQAAIKLNANNDAAYTNLATVYYQTGQFDDAQKQVEQALKIRPDDPTSHYVLGTIYLQRDPKVVTDAFDKAQGEFEAAIKNDDKMGAAYIGLANVNMFKGDYKLAIENAQKGIDLITAAGSPSPYAHWALAQAQCASGDYVNGAKSIEKINSFTLVDALFNRQVQALADRCK